MSVLARRSAAMCFLAWRAYCRPGPCSDEAIVLMTAWASVNIVTRSGPRNSLPHTAYQAAPLSGRVPSVNMMSPCRSFSASALASASSSCSNSASRVAGSSSKLVLSVLLGAGEDICSPRPCGFVLLFLLACDLYRSWRCRFYPVFLSAVRVVAARCKDTFCPPPRPVPRRYRAHQGTHKGKDIRKAADPYFPSADATKVGVGRNSGRSSSAPDPPAAPSSSASCSSSCFRRSPGYHSDTSLPASPSSSGVAFLFRRRQLPSHVRRGENAQHCPSTSPIGQQIPDRPPALPPLGILQHLRPQNLLLRLPFRAHIEKVVSRLRGALAPPALGIGADLSPCRYCPVP